MKTLSNLVTFGALGAIIFAVALILPTSPALAFSSNSSHHLGVYSLYQYKEYYNNKTGSYEGWKDPVNLPYEADPAQLFWEAMTSGTTSEYASVNSNKYVNGEVNIFTILPLDALVSYTQANWNKYEMVFFYGHNNTAPDVNDTSNEEAFWSNNNSNGTWEKIIGNWSQWGTNALPYEYFWTDIYTAKYFPGAVIYLWEPFTSILIGRFYHFDPQNPSFGQISAQDSPDGNLTQTLSCSGGLGGDLKWLILHGCQAVMVASFWGDQYNHTGVKAFSPTWAGFHLVLGHYRSYDVTHSKDLKPFADGLRAGLPVQAAYFLTDPEHNCRRHFGRGLHPHKYIQPANNIYRRLKRF